MDNEFFLETILNGSKQMVQVSKPDAYSMPHAAERNRLMQKTPS